MAHMKINTFTFNSDDHSIRIYQRVILTRLMEGKNMFFQTAGGEKLDGSDARAMVVNVSPSSDVSFHYDTEFVPFLDKNDPLAVAWADQVEKIGVLIAGGVDMSGEDDAADSAE